MAGASLDGGQVPKRPARRLVLLGASNLSRGLAVALDTARQVLGGPLDVLAAFCHGRSYGQRGGVLGHQLPGITECGLWADLAARPPTPTWALVTDVGNDLIWDVPVPQIAAWVEWCLDRLQAAGARVVLTLLPLCSIRRMTPAKFLCLRTTMFPGCRLSYATLLGRAGELNERLRDLAKARSVPVAEPRPEWYGFDPIHIRRSCYPAAWRSIMSHWQQQPAPTLPPLPVRSLRRWLYLKQLAPERRWVLGRERRQVQPAGRLPDGTTLSLY
jgi:hypothetical protein